MSSILAGLSVFGLGLATGIPLWLWLRGPRERTTSVRNPELSYLEAAVLLSPRSGRAEKAFPAMIFDLAQRGYLVLKRIPYTDRRSRLLRRPPRIGVEVLGESDGLEPREVELLRQLRLHEDLHLFGERGTFSRGGMIHNVRRELMENGLLEQRTRRSIGVIACGVLVLTGGMVYAEIGGGNSGYVGSFLAGAAVATILVGWKTATVPTRRGARHLAQLRAYLDHLRNDIDNRRRHDPQEAARRFFEVLPWLIIDRRVSERWIRRIAKALTKSNQSVEIPAWFQGNMGLDVPMITLSEAVASTISAAAPGGGGLGGGPDGGVDGGPGG